MIDKKQTIILAMNLGFFRAKDPEKQSVLIAEMMEMEEMADAEISKVTEILEAETLRRHVVSQNRIARSVDRAQKEAEKPLTGGEVSATAHVKDMPRGLYVLTTAQNNTEVCPVFFNALMNYIKRMGATLLIAKTTYNLNGFQQAQDAGGVYYVNEVQPFLVDGQISLGGIDFVAQANVLPTAKNPLAGFEGVTPIGIDAVIPASKIALKCTASLKGGKGKRLFSTGAVTLRNYIMRKAGAVAATEHNIGALIVDTRGEIPIVRQLELMPNSSGFYDNGVFYDADGGWMDAEPEALQFGDIHAEKMEAENLESMQALIRFYRPNCIILHDVMDFSSRNHHNVKDCAFMFAQQVKQNTVAGDVKEVTRVIDALLMADPSGEMNAHVIESNHDLAINTWLKNADFKLDPINALTYLQCMTALYQHIDTHGNTGFNMLKYCYNNIGGGKFADSIVFHETDESVIMAGVEMGCHGHTGTNGSKGSPMQFRALGVPMNTGHTHTPSINGACYTAGVSASLEMGYNIGASSWKLAHVLTWPNGQRQVIFA